MRSKMTQINHCGDLEKLILKMGFLPFFNIGIADFSIEEFTPQELWFSDEEDGPWEWKGPVLRNQNCAYGKLFQKKAGFVSMEWFPELVNYRRSVYDLNAASTESTERVIYETVRAHESLLSKEIKALCGYSYSVSLKVIAMSHIFIIEGGIEHLKCDFMRYMFAVDFINYCKMTYKSRW